MNAEKISGKYTHYKGRQYEVFCSAYDRNGTKYVLYRQCYADEALWIRPYDMFFESIEMDGNRVARFRANDAQALTCAEPYVQKLKHSEVRLRHSETEAVYCIAHIDAENRVTVELCDEE